MKDWKFTRYKQTGSHNSVCGDFVEVRADDERVIACLSDGFDALSNSHIASEVTVKTVVEWFSAAKIGNPNNISKKDLKTLKEDFLRDIKARLKKAAQERDIPPETMDCTLLFVCIFKQLNVALFGNLGDSALCIIRRSQTEVICNSSFIAEEPGALHNDDALQRLELELLPLDDDVLGFILTSNGLENEIYHQGLSYVDKNAAIYFDALLESIPQKRIQERVTALTDAADSAFTDDISVAVLSRADEPLTLAPEPQWPCICGNDNPLYAPSCTACGRDFMTLYRSIHFTDDMEGFFRSVGEQPEKREKLLEELHRTNAQDAAVPEAPVLEESPAEETEDTSPETSAVSAEPEEPTFEKPRKTGIKRVATIFPFMSVFRQHKEEQEEEAAAAPEDLTEQSEEEAAAEDTSEAPAEDFEAHEEGAAEPEEGDEETDEETEEEPAVQPLPPVTPLFGNGDENISEDSDSDDEEPAEEPAVLRPFRTLPIPRRRTGKSMLFVALFMALTFVVGAVLGAIMMAAIKNNRIDELESKLSRATASTETTAPAVTPTAAKATEPSDSDTTPATLPETTAPEEEPVVGVWTVNHSLDFNGNIHPAETYYVDSKTYRFHSDGTVTRDVASGDNKGTYTVEQGDEEDEYLLTFGSEELKMIYDRQQFLTLEVRDLNDETNTIKLVYVKSGSQPSGDASSQNGVTGDEDGGLAAPRIDS